MNKALVITEGNRVFWKGEILGPHREMAVKLTDEEILNVCHDFLMHHQMQVSEDRLVLTLSPTSEGYEVTLEPIVNHKDKVQGELPVMLFIKYGRNLLLNDFKALLQQLKNGVHFNGV